MPKKKIRYSLHGHVLNEQVYPWDVYAGRLTIPKTYVEPIAEVLKYSPTAVKALERIMEMVGKDKHLHLVEVLRVFTSNFGEAVNAFIKSMDEAGIDVATPLMLDMTAGNEISHPELPWDLQVKLFGELYKQTGGRLRPFYGFDPRRDGSLETCMEEIHAGRFFGVKMYPPMGFSPNYNSKRNSKKVNSRLRKLYEWAEHFGVPMNVHSSPGGIHGKDVSESDAHFYSHPNRMWDVLFDHPELIYCYAHFGGNAEFMRYWLKQDNGEDNRAATIHRQMMEFPFVMGDDSFHQSATATNKDGSFTKEASNYGAAKRECMADMFAATNTVYGNDSTISLFNFSQKEDFEAQKKHCGEFNFDLLTHENPRTMLMQNMLQELH
jgi:hypothetical protein